MLEYDGLHHADERNHMRQQFCTQCGIELSQDNNFCTQCGAPVESSPVSFTPAVSTVTTKPSGLGRRLVRYALASTILAALVVTIVYLVGIRSNGATGGANAFTVAQTATAEPVSDVHDEQGIPYPEVPAFPWKRQKLVMTQAQRILWMCGMKSPTRRCTLPMRSHYL